MKIKMHILYWFTDDIEHQIEHFANVKDRDARLRELVWAGIPEDSEPEFAGITDAWALLEAADEAGFNRDFHADGWSQDIDTTGAEQALEPVG